MKQKNRMVDTYGLLLIDLISIVVSFMAATYIRFGNYKDMGDKEIHFQVCLLFLFLSAHEHSCMYSVDRKPKLTVRCMPD